MRERRKRSGGWHDEYASFKVAGWLSSCYYYVALSLFFVRGFTLLFFFVRMVRTSFGRRGELRRMNFPVARFIFFFFFFRLRTSGWVWSPHFKISFVRVCVSVCFLFLRISRFSWDGSVFFIFYIRAFFFLRRNESLQIVVRQETVSSINGTPHGGYQT